MRGVNGKQISYMTLIGVHELHGQMHHNQDHVTTLYIYIYIYIYIYMCMHVLDIRRHTYSGTQSIPTILVYYTHNIYISKTTLLHMHWSHCF